MTYCNANFYQYFSLNFYICCNKDDFLKFPLIFEYSVYHPVTYRSGIVWQICQEKKICEKCGCTRQPLFPQNFHNTSQKHVNLDSSASSFNLLGFLRIKNIFKFFLFFVLFDTFDVSPPYTMDESDPDSVLLNRLVFGSLVDGLGYTEISRLVSILNMCCFTKE